MESGVQADEDYKWGMTGGTEFRGESAGARALSGMREGIGEGFTGGALSNAAWSGKGGVRSGG